MLGCHRPLEAHLLGAVGQQGAEFKLRWFCTLGCMSPLAQRKEQQPAPLSSVYSVRMINDRFIDLVAQYMRMFYIYQLVTLIALQREGDWEGVA